MSACNACNDDPKSIGARQPIRDNAGFVGGRPTTGIRFEKFGIDHRRAVPPHFVSIRPRERRPVARNSPAPFLPGPGTKTETGEDGERRRREGRQTRPERRRIGTLTDLSADWQTLTYILHAVHDIFIGISIHHR